MRILITGGTGSFGNAFVEYALNNLNPAVIRIFSRDELKQSEMKTKFNDKRLRFLVGDVRDEARLEQAMESIDLVIHAAAMKRVDACEYNPFEAIKTNILGTQNVVSAAIKASVPKVMVISSDKAVNPANLYGATKLCAEKIAVQANQFFGGRTKVSAARYGNVLGSRGSIIPLFKKQKESKIITITDEQMTRFFITLPQAVEFVSQAIDDMQGGEVFIPKIPSMKVVDVAKAIAPEADFQIIGKQPGEKLHEVLLMEDESRFVVEQTDRYIIEPSFQLQGRSKHNGYPMRDGFRYSSDNNNEWLTEAELKELVRDLV